MKSNFDSKKNESRKKRHEAIFKIVNKKKMKTHDDIVKELEKIGIEVTQPTVRRDLNELNITKGKNDHYKMSIKKEKETHSDIINELIRQPGIENNVSTYFLKTEKGKAQEVEYHLHEGFNNIVLGTYIGIDYVIVFAKTEEVLKEDSPNDQSANAISRKLFRELFQING